VKTTLPQAAKWLRADYFPLGLTEKFARELAGMPPIEELAPEEE